MYVKISLWKILATVLHVGRAVEYQRANDK